LGAKVLHCQRSKLLRGAMFKSPLYFFSTQLLNYRSEQPFFKSSSFSTISAFGPNAAIIHYTPTPETDAQIDTTSLYMGKREQN
jgi:hypothetical protein